MKLEIKDLFQGYGNKPVLKGISAAVESGEIVSLLGSNGAGKSTLIKTICGILPYKDGDILIDDKDIKSYSINERAKLISYVPQISKISSYTTVYDVVMTGRNPYSGWTYSMEDAEIVIDSLKIMNLEELSHNYVTNLSGGQQQRVYIARSITQKPKFYIFDEPTNSLDLNYQIEMMNVMRTVIARENAGMLIALHDLNLAYNYSDKVVLMKDGTAVSYGTPKEVITPENIKSVYGVDCKIVSDEYGSFILSDFRQRGDISQQ